MGLEGPPHRLLPLGRDRRLSPLSYVPLWCKSNYSFLEGASHPAELIETAAEYGLPSVALTDRNGVYGVVRAWEASRTVNQPFILGAQVAVEPGSTLVLLVRDREGYARLCSLLTLGHQDRPKGEFAVTWEQVSNHAQGLTALWRHEGPSPGEAAGAVLTEAFAGRAYAMVSRHYGIGDAVAEHNTLVQARRWNLPPVAVTEVLYHDAQRQALHDVVTCIRHGVRLADAGTKLRPNAEHALLTPAAFLERYTDHPEWVARTHEIAEACQFSLGEVEYRYPEEGVPSGYTTAQWLRQKTTEGALLRYHGRVEARVQEQLEKELALIEELRYSGYFLTMWEIVQFCKAKGILCQGRGSAANSAVCYCLGITAVDPVQMNLLFERFLSRERSEPPDIDLDIEHDRREEVIQHMYQKYGRHRAAMVANVVRYRSRSALREVGKVLGMSEVDLDRNSKLLSHHGGLTELGLDPHLTALASELQGFPRHLSIHPGGFLLGSEALSRIVPVENATMKDRTIIQWDKEDVESMNLFKVDLLGLGALTHLDYAFRLLQQHYGRSMTLAEVPHDDPAVFDSICRADTVGVFQIESRAQMSMLPRLKPRHYYDLVIEVSLVRPGPITGDMVHPYLRRRDHKEAITYPHPSLEPVLKRTLGIPLFQEQVMKLAMVAADYTPGEADQLRRDMAAWKSTGRIERHREVLIGRMVAKGIAPEFAERVFQQILGFGEYGFPESHAASFALIAYATAWVKHHYPDVFTCALLNAWPMGFYSPATVVGDARRHRVHVLPPDLLHSEWECTLEAEPGWPRFAVRMGLSYIQGLAEADARRVLALRKPQPWGLSEWKAQAGVSIAVWEKLAVSGALEGFGVHRRSALWQVLDDQGPDPLVAEAPEQDLVAPTAHEALEWDYASMGLSSTAHFLEPYRAHLRSAGYSAAVEVNHRAASSRVRYAGLVICRQRPGNAKGVLFMTLEDETGLVNAVVWEKVWDRYRTVILTSQLLAMEGKLQVEEGVVHLIVGRLWVPEEFPELIEAPQQSHDFR